MRGPIPAQRGNTPRTTGPGPGPNPDAVERYLEQAVRGDGRSGVRLALDLIDNGVPAGDVIVNLLGQAQREVGQRWLANRWTVAEEHLVSGVTQKALDVIATRSAAAAGLIAVACAEGDWHSLPAQMFAEMLRARLRGRFPRRLRADHVAVLSRRRPDALAVSCNLALFFGGVTRLADAAHRHDIPVLDGGRALGRAPERAACLGADAWAPGIDDAVAVLRGWQRERPRVSAARTPFKAAAVQLDAIAPVIAGEALGSLRAGYPPAASFSEKQLARAREQLAAITRFTAAARLVDDQTVLTEMLDWLRTFLTSRGVPAAALRAGLDALAPIIRRTDPGAARLVLDASRDEPAFTPAGESG